MLDTSVLPTILLDRNVFKKELTPHVQMEHRAPNGLAHLLNHDARPSIEVEVNDCRLVVVEENGRFYHDHKRGKYPFPCDAPERDRQDMTHHLIYGILLNHYDPHAPIALENGQHRPNVLAGPVPPISPTRVLDLGCGSGLWTLDAASRFPRALIEGADLAGGQPSTSTQSPYPTAEIRWRTPDAGIGNVFDFDEPRWRLPPASYDLIHASQLCGGVTDWRQLVQNAKSTLRPGGWFESIEIDFEPCCDDGTLPVDSPLMAWWHCIRNATQNKSIEYPKNLPIIMKEAGLVDVQCITIPLPVSAWFYQMPDAATWIERHMVSSFAHTGCATLQLPRANWVRNIRDAADWWNMILTNDPSFAGCQVFHGLSMAPFTNRLGWTKEQVEAFVPQLMSCVGNKSYHTYFKLHIVIGRKPQSGYG